MKEEIIVTLPVQNNGKDVCPLCIRDCKQGAIYRARFKLSHKEERTK